MNTPPPPLYYLPPFFQLLSNHHFPVTSNPHLPCSFFDWMGDCITFDVLFYLMIDIMHLHMSRLGTLMPEGLDVCFVQQGVKSTEVWHMWFFPGTLIWYYTQTNKQTNKQTNTHTHTHTHTHTQKDTQHTQVPADSHTHINIYLHHLLSAHNSYLYYIE